MLKWLKVRKLRKPTLPEIYRFFASRLFSYVALIAVIGLLAMWIIPFQIYGVPGWRVQNMANKVWFFRLSYFLAYLSLVLCMLQLLFSLRRRKKPQERVYQSVAEIFHLPNYYVRKVPNLTAALTKLDSGLVKERYRVFHAAQGEGHGSIYAVKGENSRWGTLVFHLSLLLIIFGVFLSLKTSFYGETIATEGQSFIARTDSFTSPQAAELEAIRKRIPDFSFKLDQVRPVFWQDKMLFTNLEADVTYPADSQANFTTVKLNSPLFHGGTWLELAGFGYSPYFILKDKDNRILYESYVNLGIFPSGSEDYFTIPGLPHEIHVILWSDAAVENGNVHSKSYNLVNPVYTVYIVKDKEPGKVDATSENKQSGQENKQLVVQGNYKPGEPIRFEGYTLSFPDIRYYGQFRLIYDPGVLLVFGGFCFMISGLIWRMLFFRRQIWVLLEQTQEGSILHWAGTSEYYRASFAEEITNIMNRALGEGRQI